MNLFELFAVLKLDKSSYESSLNEAESSASSGGSKIGNALSSGLKVGAAAVAAAATAVVAFGKESVEVGATFDSSMSQVAATMGYTTEEINTQGSEANQTMQKLRDFAQEMGSTTAFSATEAADALNYMALAGYDADESMEMLPTVLNLAAAGGMDLATASDMVTDAQSALGLTTEETVTMVDQMAAAASSSNTSVSQLGEAFLTVGGTAKTLSGGTTELSTALGILADNGIKGSEGGTKLRNIIMSLQTPTDDAAEAMNSLGVEVYDAEGNMRPMNDILNDLNDSMDGMTTAEKQNIISTIFNKTDIAAVNALLSNSGERWDELTEAIEGSEGAAEAMSKVQLDNLNGDVTLFKSALEGAQIAISDVLTPSLRDFVQMATEGLSEVTTAFKEDGLTGAMEALGTFLSDVIAKIIEILPQVMDAGLQLVMALVQGIVDNIDQIVTAVTTIIESFVNFIVENLDPILDGAIQIIVALVEGLIEALPKLAEACTKIMLGINEYLLTHIPELIEVAIELVVALAQGIAESYQLVLTAWGEVLSKGLAKLEESLPEWLEKGCEFVVSLIEGIAEKIEAFNEKLKELIDKGKEAIKSKWEEIKSTGAEMITTFIEGIKNKFSDLVSTGKDIIEQCKSGITSVISNARQWGADMISNFKEGITSAMSSLLETVSNMANKIKGFLGFSEPEVGPLSDFHTYAPDMMKLFAKGIKDNTHLVTDQLEKSFDFGDTLISASGTIEAEGSSSRNGYAAGSVVNIYPQNLDQSQIDYIINAVNRRLGGVLA